MFDPQVPVAIITAFVVMMRLGPIVDRAIGEARCESHDCIVTVVLVIKMVAHGTQSSNDSFRFNFRNAARSQRSFHRPDWLSCAGLVGEADATPRRDIEYAVGGVDYGTFTGVIIAGDPYKCVRRG